MRLEFYSTTLFNVVNRNKSVSRMSFTEENAQTILRFFDLVNNAPAEIDSINGREFKTMKIPQTFACLVAPKSVRVVSGDRKYTDLLERVSLDEDVTYEQALDAFDTLFAALRRVPSYDTAVSDIRVDVALSSVMDKVLLVDEASQRSQDSDFGLDGDVQWDGNTTLIPLNVDNVGLVKEPFFNYQIDEVVSESFRNIIQSSKI